MKIVVLDGYALNPGDLSWDELKALGDVVIYDRTASEDIIERSRGANIILTNKTPLNKDFFSKMPDLKYVGVLATGYNIVDIEAARGNNVIVTNVPTYSTISVAQLVFALLLELCHNVKEHSVAVKKGQWSNCADFSFWNHPLIELEGKTLGILGFGRIGQKVADIANIFGMKVMACSRTESNQSNRNNFAWVDMNQLLTESDFISLHCPLFEETKGIINMDSIKKMKNSAFLINTARGPLIVEDDLAEALNTGIISGAGLDVLSTEPPNKDNPLLKAENCIITPHIAWATKEARVRLMDITIDNLKAYICGKAVNVVNP